MKNFSRITRILNLKAYAYDVMGNKTGIIKERRGLDEESGSYSYGYDELNRLTSVSRDGALIREYSFDAFSNRSVLKDHGRGMSTAYHYNALNQLISEETAAFSTADEGTLEKTYHYDRRGNLIKECRGEALIHGYEYGSMNRLTRSWNDSEEAGYIYNGLGHRVGRETGKDDHGQTYLIDMLRPYHNLLNLTDTMGRSQDFIYDGNVAGSIGAACMRIGMRASSSPSDTQATGMMRQQGPTSHRQGNTDRKTEGLVELTGSREMLDYMTH